MQAEENEAMKTHLMGNYKNKKQQFDSIFDSSMHEVGCVRQNNSCNKLWQELFSL